MEGRRDVVGNRMWSLLTRSQSTGGDRHPQMQLPVTKLRNCTPVSCLVPLEGSTGGLGGIAELEPRPERQIGATVEALVPC